MSYVRGGKDGTFAGSASFVSLNNTTVVFDEQGTATLAPNNDEYQARHGLLYQAEPDESMSVFFDEARDRDSPASILAGARFFHKVEFGGIDGTAPLLSEHPCGPDIYRGRLALDSPDTFRLLWSVSGPRKLGTVASTFRRTSSALRKSV